MLSSTESEYTGLEYTLREVISIMQLLKDLKRSGFSIEPTTPKVKCRVFEDNCGSLDMATVHKHRAIIKQLNKKLHHF